MIGPSEKESVLKRAAWEKQMGELNGRYGKIEDSFNRLGENHIAPNTCENACLSFIADDLENLARAFRKLDSDRQLPPSPLSEEEAEEVLDIHEHYKARGEKQEPEDVTAEYEDRQNFPEMFKRSA